MFEIGHRWLPCLNDPCTLNFPNSAHRSASTCERAWTNIALAIRNAFSTYRIPSGILMLIVFLVYHSRDRFSLILDVGQKRPGKRDSRMCHSRPCALEATGSTLGKRTSISFATPAMRFAASSACDCPRKPATSRDNYGRINALIRSQRYWKVQREASSASRVFAACPVD